jgi:hypothetical protein
MHPKLMITLARQVERDRQDERQLACMRAQTRNPRQGVFVRRPFAGIALRPRLS